MARPVARMAALSRNWPAMLGCAALMLALPFAIAGVFPSQDGPAHAHTAQLLRMLDIGEAPVADAFLHPIDPGFSNSLAPSLLSLLMRFLPAQAAEWAIALLLTAMLGGSVVASLRLAGSGAEQVGLGALLCAPLMLYMGSFSLVMALAAGFLALACAAAFIARGTAWLVGAFLVLALVACVANVQVAVPIVAATLGGAAGTVAWRMVCGGGLRIPRQLIVLVGSVLPVIVLAAVYRARLPEGHAADGASWNPLRQAGVLLLRGEVVWFWIGDPILLGATSVLLGLAVMWWLARDARAGRGIAPSPRNADLRLAQAWMLWGALALLCGAMLLPMHTIAVPQITHRIAPFAQFLLLLWFASAGVALPRKLRGAVVATALVTGAGATAARTIGHAVMERRIAELSWAEQAIPSSGVAAMLHLPAAIGEFKSPALAHGGLMLRFDPLATFGRGLDGREVVDFSNYQFRPYFNIFRLQFRPEVNAAASELQAPWIAVRDGTLRGRFREVHDRMAAATGHHIDTIVVMTGGLDQDEIARTHPNFADFRQALRAEFALAGRSAPSGYVEVWRRR